MLLGTLPGATSLKKEYYYADEKNYFWDFFCEYTGHDEPKSNEAVTSHDKVYKKCIY